MDNEPVRLENESVNDLVKAYLPQLKGLLRVLKTKFKAPIVRPGMDMEQIMFDAGSYYVLEHFETLIKQAENEKEIDDVLT